MMASTVSIGRKHTTSLDMSWFARMFCVRVSSGGSCVAFVVADERKARQKVSEVGGGVLRGPLLGGKLYSIIRY